MRTWAAVAGLVCLAAAGCGPSSEMVPGALYVPAGDYDKVFRTTARQIRREGFRLIVERPETGEILTAYKIAPTIFEPWGLQAGTVYDVAEDTLHAVRRMVKARVSRDVGGILVTVEVYRQRQGYYQDRRPVYSKALYLFQDELLSPELIEEPRAAAREKADIWVSLGRDGAMEKEILKRIEWRVKKRVRAEAEKEPAAPDEPPEKTIWDEPGPTTSRRP